MEYDYTWLGYGLLVVTPNGTRLVEGDIAREAHNELNMAGSVNTLTGILERLLKTEHVEKKHVEQVRKGWSYF